MPAISFHIEDVEFAFSHKGLIREWLTTVLEKEGRIAGELSFIFCSDKYLLQMNQQFLNHDEFTDVITFDYSDSKLLHGDIFISVERVKENALTQKASFHEELHRVMVHGVLHIVGYKDKEPKATAEMRSREDQYLALLKR